MVAALRSAAGASRRLLLTALDRKVELLVSVPLMVEYEAVLTRPEHLEASGLTVADVNGVLDGIAAVGVPVRLRFLWRPQLRDVNDEMVLETAVNGHAEVLVTFNIRHLAAAAKRFGIRALQPRDAWKEVRRLNEE